MTFELEQKFNVSPEVLYKAWLSSKQHSEMTGAKAVCSAKVNGKFSAWDGYITGNNKELIPYSKIVQAWRTTEFSETDPSAELTISFFPHQGGCILKLHHDKIPKGHSDYKRGWIDFYFTPMLEYFQ
jgi:activator of HSP90 ATPase